MSDVEILSIGDELLRGIVADTNSHWMAKRIAARGAALRRVVVLPDDPPEVAASLRESLARSPSLILTQGGLGPTDDDRTREAVSLATGKPLEPHAEAEAIVRGRYEALAGAVAGAALGEARLRMSRLPRGAVALDNQVGGAPGVLLSADASTIVCLPGVPQELRWIWEHPLAPHLDRILGPGGYAEATVTLEETDESRIAAVVGRVAERHPGVYVKSRATAFGEPDPRVRVTLAATGGSDAAAGSQVNLALQDLTGALSEIGVSVAG